ncbi:adenine phosphoribosyltransferase 1-like isoform X1 [Phoenix dactylifera]|uniref:adenine phosphoribosyltransferase n=1 Tax=Phoenix dactylifera TaxID=42345 RepID=A0A8B9A766_PHODC|nr:adenine phosphoribosyltransferase 1-like isoform X1 [Phoenix dactylifera]
MLGCLFRSIENLFGSGRVPGLTAKPSQWPCYDGPAMNCGLLACGFHFDSVFVETVVSTLTLLPGPLLRREFLKASLLFDGSPYSIFLLPVLFLTCLDLVGIEARGFIFGPPIALAIGAKFVPLRKPRKLPGEVISEEYVLEYGTDCLQMHIGAVQPGDRALVVDDLIATGGTLCAAIKLLERAGAEVVECACVIELPELKGRERLNGKPLYILVESR